MHFEGEKKKGKDTTFPLQQPLGYWRTEEKIVIFCLHERYK